MPDKVIICQNCHNPFVYSEYEQNRDTKTKTAEPLCCPICTAIKQSEAKRPPKPTSKNFDVK